MTIEQLTQLFDYMYWANCQMWQCVIELDEDQLTTDPGYSIGSIRAQLVHMMTIDNLWINYLWHGEVEFLQADHFLTLSQIRTEWDALEEEARDYLSTLTSDNLAQWVAPPFLNLPTMKLGDMLIQLVNHSTDHRAQILAGIHGVGGMTIAQDYTHYLRHQSPYRQIA